MSHVMALRLMLFQRRLAEHWRALLASLDASVATLRDGKGQSQLAIGQGPNKEGGASHRAVAPKWRATVDEDRHFYFAIPL
jgi:hypothetical protein